MKRYVLGSVSSGLERMYWSVQSRVWDDLLHDSETARHISEIADWMADAVTDGGVVVALGCGTGNYTLALASRGVPAVGLDFAPGMLDRAARKQDDGLVGGARFVRCDLRRPLPLADHSLAGALSIYSVQFFEPDRLFREVRRVLRPGGSFLVEAPVSGSPPRHAPPGIATWRRWLHGGRRLLSRAGVACGFVTHHDEDRLHRALAETGFTLLERRIFDRSYALLARA